MPRWVHFVQKTRAKNSHAWAPLNAVFKNIFFVLCVVGRIQSPGNIKLGFAQKQLSCLLNTNVRICLPTQPGLFLNCIVFFSLYFLQLDLL
jgi:hypothetical protein